MRQIHWLLTIRGNQIFERWLKLESHTVNNFYDTTLLPLLYARNLTQNTHLKIELSLGVGTPPQTQFRTSKLGKLGDAQIHARLCCSWHRTTHWSTKRLFEYYGWTTGLYVAKNFILLMLTCTTSCISKLEKIHFNAVTLFLLILSAFTSYWNSILTKTMETSIQAVQQMIIPCKLCFGKHN